MATGVVCQPQTQLVQTTDTAFPWAVNVGPYSAKFASALNATSIYQFTVQGYTFSYQAQALSYVDAAGKHQVLASVASVAPAVSADGQTLTYDASTNGYKVSYVIKGDRVKMYITLLQAPTAPDPTLIDVNTAALSSFDVLTIPSGLTPYAEGAQITAATRTAGTIELRDSGGNVVMYFDRVTGSDANGVVLRGEYLVQQVSGQWQLYTLVDWRQLKPGVAVYPVTIDPTTVATASNNLMSNFTGGKHQVVAYSNGTLLAAGYNSSNSNSLTFYYSVDKGITWTILSSGSTVSPWVGAEFSIAIDSNDYVHLTVMSGGANYQRGTPTTDRTGMTWSANTVVWSDTSYYNASGSIVPHVIGTDIWVHMAWSFQNGTNSGNSARYGRVHVTSTGTITVDTTYQWGFYTSGWYTEPTIVVDPSNNVFVVFNNPDSATTPVGTLLVKGTYAASPSWTWGALEQVATQTVDWGSLTAVSDSQGRILIAFRSFNSTTVYVKERAAAGGYTDRSPSYTSKQWASSTPGTMSLTVDSNDNVYLGYIDNATGYPYYGKLTRSTLTWGSAVVVESVAASWPLWKYGVSATGLDMTYWTGSYTLREYHLAFNTAPTAPTNLSIGSGTAFDGTLSTTASCIYNDTPGDTCVAYQAQFYRTSDNALLWDTGAVTVSPAVASGNAVSFTIPANKFTNGTDGTWQIKLQDAGGLWSVYSSAAAFHAEATPTTTITAPSSNLTGSQITVTGTYAQANSKAMQAVEIQLFTGSSATGTPLEDDTVSTSTSPWSKTLTTVGQNSTAYTVQARTQTADGLWGAWSTAVTFTVSYTPTATPSLTAVQDTSNPAMLLTATNPAPTGSQPQVASVLWKRSKDGGSTWTTLATTQLTPSTQAVTVTYRDYTAAAATTYQYQAVAVGTNGTQTSSASATASVALKHLWLTDLSTNLSMKLVGNCLLPDETANQPTQVYQAVDGTQTTMQAPVAPRTVQISGLLYDLTLGTVFAQYETWRAFITNGNVKLLRDSQGRAISGTTAHWKDTPGDNARAPGKPLPISFTLYEVN